MIQGPSISRTVRGGGSTSKKQKKTWNIPMTKEMMKCMPGRLLKLREWGIPLQIFYIYSMDDIITITNRGMLEDDHKQKKKAMEEATKSYNKIMVGVFRLKKIGSS